MFLNPMLPDCPTRETEWPCPEPVKLSPERMEQKNNKQKKIFRNKHTKKILGSVKKIELVHGKYTVYVFSDGSRWSLEDYYKHLEAIPLYSPFLSDYGINRKDNQGFTPVVTYQATNDMFEWFE